MNKGILIAGLTGIIAVGGITTHSLYAQKSDTQLEDTVPTEYITISEARRLSGDLNIPVEEVYSMVRDMHTPVTQLFREEGFVALADWRDYKLRNDFVLDKNRSGWFEEFLGTYSQFITSTREKTSSFIAQRDVSSESKKITILYFYGDDPDSTNVDLSRGGAVTLKKLHQVFPSIHIIQLNEFQKNQTD